MSVKPENPSAFPTFEEIDQWDKDSEKYRETMFPTRGMTLRDYFAAHALIANMIGRGQWIDARTGQKPIEVTPSMRAEAAYHQADAMLTERSK